MRLAGLVLVVVIAGCAGPVPTPSAVPEPVTPGPSVAPSATPTAVPTPTPMPSPVITCVRETGPVASGLGGDQCPAAIAATLATVAPLDLTVVRIYLAPGRFACGDFWNTGTHACFEALILPGTEMFGWVRFDGTPKVAAVQLSRRLPTASAPASPWKGRLAAFDVPPARWSMP
jgi:hypothetical protein